MVHKPEYVARHYRKHRLRILERKRLWYIANKERLTEKRRANSEVLLRRHREWHRRNWKIIKVARGLNVSMKQARELCQQ